MLFEQSELGINFLSLAFALGNFTYKVGKVCLIEREQIIARAIKMVCIIRRLSGHLNFSSILRAKWTKYFNSCRGSGTRSTAGSLNRSRITKRFRLKESESNKTRILFSSYPNKKF